MANQEILGETQLSGRLTVAVKLGVKHYGPYVQFKRQKRIKQCTWRAVNFSRTVWQQITAKCEDITLHLEKGEVCKYELSASHSVQVVFFKGNGIWYVSINKQDKRINLDRNEWNQLQNYSSVITEQLDRLEVKPRVTSQPRAVNSTAGCSLITVLRITLHVELGILTKTVV